MAEVVVVGGGPAGAATALHLARRGREVVLVERAEFPRRKPCGEGLFPRGVRELRDLGVLERLEAMPLDRLRFHGYGKTAEARLGSEDTPAMGVSRAALDAALIGAARRSGVEVGCGMQAAALTEAGARFDVIAGRRYSEAAVVVAADGLGSRLRRAAGIEASHGGRYGLSAHVKLRASPDCAVDVHFFDGFEVYVTPVAPRTVNVAVLMSKGLAAQFGGSPDATMAQLLTALEILPAGWRFIDAAMMAGPFGVRPARLWRRNVVLCGDAAGFFDGITGEGMSLALASARDCAAAVDGFLRDGDEKHFRSYERRRRTLARNSELLGRLTLFLSRRRWTARRALSAFSRHPDVFSRLLAVSSGERRLSSLRPWDLVAPLLG